ncbi:hypothetical protein TeGR_g13412 [Tetraparma gracilis]|uniref:Uncharacterized protein n=1 Tax=Tetraparma gracilis TaxID=2962635 RepID=A0ABQ6M541_9STRA|nr:hypothetical protein TeGR_g13412 [Tetraparma gracilis]
MLSLRIRVPSALSSQLLPFLSAHTDFLPIASAPPLSLSVWQRGAESPPGDSLALHSAGSNTILHLMSAPDPGSQSMLTRAAAAARGAAGMVSRTLGGEGRNAETVWIEEIGIADLDSAPPPPPPAPPPSNPLLLLTEIAVPFPNSSPLLETLMSSYPSPPRAAGVFTLSPSTPALRPLPTSSLDYFHTPPPCLTFHSSLPAASFPYPSAPLGSGAQHLPQLQLAVSPDADVRVDPLPAPRPYFLSGTSELLSSSVPSLQSANVTEAGSRDEMLGVGTCWDEFKVGYFSKGGESVQAKHAKASPNFSLRE